MLNTHRVTESAFWFDVKISRWRPWRPFIQQSAVLPLSEWKWNVCRANMQQVCQFLITVHLYCFYHFIMNKVLCSFSPDTMSCFTVSLAPTLSQEMLLLLTRCSEVWRGRWAKTESQKLHFLLCTNMGKIVISLIQTTLGGLAGSRPHNKTLVAMTVNLSEIDFLIRMLHKDCY